MGARYRSEEYSSEFNQLVDRVTNKIYRRKAKRRFLVVSKISPEFIREEEGENSLNVSNASASANEGSSSGVRKNSPNTKNSFFYRTIKHGRPKPDL